MQDSSIYTSGCGCKVEDGTVTKCQRHKADRHVERGYSLNDAQAAR
jgi:hypothetical protein